jgi:Protein of unknown function (DUF2510)
MRVRSIDELRRALEATRSDEIEIEYHEADIWPATWSGAERGYITEVARIGGFVERSFRIGGSASIRWGSPGDQYLVLNLTRASRSGGNMNGSLQDRVSALRLEYPTPPMALIVRQQFRHAANAEAAAVGIRDSYRESSWGSHEIQIIVAGRAFYSRYGEINEECLLCGSEALEPGRHIVMFSKLVPAHGTIDRTLIESAANDWYENDGPMKCTVISPDGSMTAFSFPGVQNGSPSTDSVSTGTSTLAAPPAPASAAAPQLNPPKTGSSPPPPPPPTPAAWHPDPFKRFQYRYWDGSVWTSHVSENGVVQSDPPT